MADEQLRNRRAFIRAGTLGATSVALIAGTAVASNPAGAAPLALTPACDGHETPANVEGPVFRPDSPQCTKVADDTTPGVPLLLHGVVRDTSCRPLVGVLLDFWQCDHNGDYDTDGYALRGHQYSGPDGGYRLETIVPRDYYGRWGQRTAHIHAHVQATGGPELVTQLFFPDDTLAYGRDFATLNAGDRFMNRACTITLSSPRPAGYRGQFDFVVATSA